MRQRETPRVRAAHRVLIAIDVQQRRRVAEILADCECCFVSTGDQLLRALDESDYDLLLVGAHFDQSRALASVQHVLRRQRSPPVVFVRVAGFSSGLRKPAIEALRLAAAELGVHDFIDLLGYPDDVEGNARVRRMLERLLTTT